MVEGGYNNNNERKPDIMSLSWTDITTFISALEIVQCKQGFSICGLCDVIFLTKMSHIRTWARNHLNNLSDKF